MNYLDRLTALNQLDSFRLGLWQLMMQRNQMHLAHSILTSGFRCMFYIERVQLWGKWEEAERIMVESCVAELVNIAQECSDILDGKGQAPKYRLRVERLKVELGTLGRSDAQMGATERKKRQKKANEAPENLYANKPQQE